MFASATTASASARSTDLPDSARIAACIAAGIGVQILKRGRVAGGEGAHLRVTGPSRGEFRGDVVWETHFFRGDNEPHFGGPLPKGTTDAIPWTAVIERGGF